MLLTALPDRAIPPAPWGEGENIPWHEPAFSARMLHEHLTQAHDAASRRQEIIAAQVTWLHETICAGEPTTVLDLGCGPGLYTQQLAAHGHHCHGIDYSPASIAYAEATATQTASNCTYTLADLRSTDYGRGLGLILLLYGEFNVFPPPVAQTILARCYASLRPGGVLVLEPHTFAAIAQRGQQPATWYTRDSGLFAATPHLVLREQFWHPAEQVATIRYFVVELASLSLTRYAQSMQAYDSAGYLALLNHCGFTDITSYPALAPQQLAPDPDFVVLVARKPLD